MARRVVAIQAMEATKNVGVKAVQVVVYVEILLINNVSLVFLEQKEDA